jgi:alcohol-forming fatty acyl-CoA reductase
MEEKPDVLKKIFPVWGEVTEANLGLCDENLQHIIAQTNIIFHLAASLKLENTIKPNILINLTGTKNVLDVAKQMKNLVMMVHTSTAFCNIEHEVVEERVYDFPHRPLDIIRAAEWLSEESMAKVQKDILGIHPNTYTYTKRLAEILIRDEYKNSNFPVCIVRPSIVTPSFWEPVAGWVDSLNGPPGILIAAGKGVLRTIYLNPNATFEAIPVDMAVNGMLMFAYKHGTSSERSE